MDTAAFIIAVCIVYTVPTASSQSEAGPYVIKIESIKKCADEGTKDYSLTADYNAEKDTFSGVVDKQKDLGDNALVKIELQQMDGNEWKNEFTQTVGGVCSLIKAAPEAVKTFLEAINFKDCPIPKGTVEIKDMKNSFMMPFLNEMTYGKRQGAVSFVDKDGKILGCIQFTSNVIPKPT